MEKFLTSEQVATLLQIHPFTVLKYLKSGKLPGVKIGRMYRIKESDVEKFLGGAAIKADPPKPDGTPESVAKSRTKPKPKKKQEKDPSPPQKDNYYLI